MQLAVCVDGWMCGAAVQKEKGSKVQVKGELFGLGNLFRLAVDHVPTLDTIKKNHKPFEIQEYDLDSLGTLPLLLDIILSHTHMPTSLPRKYSPTCI